MVIKEQYCSLHCQAQIHNDFEDKIKEIQVVDTNSLKLIDAKSILCGWWIQRRTIVVCSNMPFLQKMKL